MALSPEQIAGRRFVVALRGYDRDEVDSFLKEVSEHVESITRRDEDGGAARIGTSPANELIHPTADVASSAVIGEGTRVWHHAQLREGATVGSGCILGKGVYIDAGVVIGDNCKLENGVFVYGPTVLEDGVFLGPGAIVTNDRIPRAVTPDGRIKDAGSWTASGGLIRRGAALGAGCVLLPGVSVGRWALAGAGSVVTHDVPNHGLVVGNPARLVGFVCACGARLAGDPSAQGQPCATCGLQTDREN